MPTLQKPKIRTKKFIPVITPPRVIKKRWHKKKSSLHTLANNIRSVRNKITRDLKADDEKTRLTALVIAIMDCTAERVGNEDSARNGHFGVTGFRKKHIRIKGNTVTLRYTGKTGVKQEKNIADADIANALKEAVKNSPSRFIFTTTDGFRIKADKVNRYLEQFGITAKVFRGYCANTYIINKLKKEEIEADENKRKKTFNSAVKYAAQKVGHGPATLRKHYLVPELPELYITKGEIINLSDFYEKGGTIKESEIKNQKSVKQQGDLPPSKMGGGKDIISFLTQKKSLSELFS